MLRTSESTKIPENSLLDDRAQGPMLSHFVIICQYFGSGYSQWNSNLSGRRTLEEDCSSSKNDQWKGPFVLSLLANVNP